MIQITVFRQIDQLKLTKILNKQRRYFVLSKVEQHETSIYPWEIFWPERSLLVIVIYA